MRTARPQSASSACVRPVVSGPKTERPRSSAAERRDLRRHRRARRRAGAPGRGRAGQRGHVGRVARPPRRGRRTRAPAPARPARPRPCASTRPCASRPAPRGRGPSRPVLRTTRAHGADVRRRARDGRARRGRGQRAATTSLRAPGGMKWMYAFSQRISSSFSVRSTCSRSRCETMPTRRSALDHRQVAAAGLLHLAQRRPRASRRPCATTRSRVITSADLRARRGRGPRPPPGS